MRFLFYTTIILFTLSAATVRAQDAPQPFPCGTTGATDWFKWYTQHRHELPDNSQDTNWLYVPMTVHIVGTDAGTGYMLQDNVFRIICEMNAQYEESRIRFYLYPGDAFRYINKTSWYDHDWQGGAEMINTQKIPGRVNAFIVGDPAGVCGYSWFDAIVMSKSCSGAGNATWAHEAGHHLSLPHPFLGWEGVNWDYDEAAPPFVDGHPVERVDSSNCYNSGDFFCDTRPDYLNFRWPCTGNGQSNTVQTDPAGSKFRSDASLIMGYSFDGCSSRFTPEQIQAMRQNLYTEHNAYLQIDQPLPEIPDDAVSMPVFPVDTQLVQFNNLTLNWAPVPNATYYSVEIGLFATMVPKLVFRTYNNATSVTLTSGIPNNRLLFWRVRAYSEWDVCQSFAAAPVAVFKTADFTATNELERIAEATLSPNPTAQGQPAVLQVASEQAFDASLRVFDAAGRKLIDQPARVSVGENQLEVPTQSLAPGMYTVSLLNELGNLTIRLVVL